MANGNRKWAGAALALALGLAGLSAGGYAPEAQAARSRPSAAAAVPLSAAEIAELKFMREEEKLARDVYWLLGEKWGLTVFWNIKSSEEQHTSTVLQMLEKYGIADPASPLRGVFSDPELQKLYDELAARGSASKIEALKVGGLIEEADMIDLKDAIATSTHADLDKVYGNLLEGSKNHLRAFVGVLEAQGIDYEAQLLSQGEVDAILAE